MRVLPTRDALFRPYYQPGRTTDGRGKDSGNPGVGGSQEGDWLRYFLELAIYYSRFISGYSDRNSSVTELLKKSKPCVWSKECKKAFEGLKAAVTE